MVNQFYQLGHQIQVIIGKNISTMIVLKNRVMALRIAWFRQKEVSLPCLFIIDMSKIIVILQKRTLGVMDDTRWVADFVRQIG